MPAPGADTHLLLRAFADELGRCGVADACTSPGSRSAPLVLALTREPALRCHSHIDERCAGFFAAGLAQATGDPVAITCTSGTAAANLLPAVVEAFHAGLPLVVLTADRPPELRGVGAGQTIDQIGLFGTAAKWFFEVGTHDATPERVRWMRALACRAVWTALDRRPGPVHLNFALREPLVADPDLGPDPAAGRPGRRPWLTRDVAAEAVGAAREALLHAVGPARRGVVVAGRLPDAATGAVVARHAHALGWPVLADPLSGARRGPAAIAHYDALLRLEPFLDGVRPDAVVRAGELPTCKPLRAWLDSLGADVPQIALDPARAGHDPSAAVGLVLQADPGEVLAAPAGIGPAEAGWLARWRDADARAAGAIGAALGEGLSEPNVARALTDRLGSDATLFVASSMPIRDVESFCAVHDHGPRILSNRGANGIDGTVSSAFGVAAASSGPTVLVIGDVALAHDIGGLLAARRLGLSLTIVVLHNDGGGIFEFLPVAGQRDAFEEHVATPHGLDFAHAAALYGCRHVTPRTLDELGGELDAASRHATTTIIEIRTDRHENLALHRAVSATVAGAFG